MIEEIKKEIDAKTWWRDNNDGKFYNCCKVGDDRTPIIKIDDLFEILNNQPDYKSSWEELKNKTNEELKRATWAGTGLNDTKIRMQELEQKYNLGGE